MASEYSETFFLSAGETNAEQELSLTLLTAKIIDIATAHANALGIGNPSMSDMHAGWVLSRLTIEMSDYPKVNDTYTLTTWIESWNRHFSERAFMITCRGRVMGYARSIWMVMGTDTRQNMGLSHLSLPEDSISSRICPIERQARHRPIMQPDTAPLQPGAIMATAKPADYTFRYCDLDSYRHVNTVRYVTMLLNQFSLDDFDSTLADRIELSFLHETRYGMTVELLRSDSETDPLLSSFSLINKENGTGLLFARLRRRKRKLILS